MYNRVGALLLAIVALACGSSGKSQQPQQQSSTPLTCGNTVQASVLPDGMVDDLGTIQVGSVVNFNVGTGIASFVIITQEVGQTALATITADGSSTPNAVVPTNLVGPGGTLYYNDFANPPTTSIGGFTYFDVTQSLVVDQGFQPVVGALPFPTTSAGLTNFGAAGQVPAGSWSFTLNDWSNDCPFQTCSGGNHNGVYHVSVILNPITAPATGGIRNSGTLDVDVYLATDSTTSLLPNAATAASSSHAARWQSTLSALLGNAGITLGNVSFHDLSTSVRNQFAPNGSVNVTSTGPCDDLPQLFTHALSPNNTQGVNIFFADTIVDTSLGSNFRIAGMDGSIPGPTGFPGTITSGALVGLEDLGAGSCVSSQPDFQNCGDDATAYVTAHEVGHWLGLYHPTEQDGVFFDPVSDTSVCPCQVCAPTAPEKAACTAPDFSKSGTTLMDNSWCVVSPTCGGGDNLMFWLFNPPFSQGLLSPQQGEIARLSPAVH